MPALIDPTPRILTTGSVPGCQLALCNCTPGDEAVLKLRGIDYRCRPGERTLSGGAIGYDNHLVENILRASESDCHALTEYSIGSLRFHAYIRNLNLSYRRIKVQREFTINVRYRTISLADRHDRCTNQRLIIR